MLATATAITIRSQGANRSYPIKDLPPGLVDEAQELLGELLEAGG